jgi:hypothetical protein
MPKVERVDWLLIEPPVKREEMRREHRCGECLTFWSIAFSRALFANGPPLMLEVHSVLWLRFFFAIP